MPLSGAVLPDARVEGSKTKTCNGSNRNGAAIAGGRWNHERTPAVYMGFTPAIYSLETFVHTNGEPVKG
ncbi:RES domain-containing protein [Pseudomonas asuensis]|nr:RES domain-containing protein [Pseudomonas asuensis]